MNRADMVRMTANSVGVTAEEVNRVLTGFLDVIGLTLACGEAVALRRFGKWEVRRRPAITRPNPRSGEPMSIPPKLTVTFLPSKNLKARLND